MSNDPLSIKDLGEVKMFFRYKQSLTPTEEGEDRHHPFLLILKLKSKRNDDAHATIVSKGSRSSSSRRSRTTAHSC